MWSDAGAPGHRGDDLDAAEPLTHGSVQEGSGELFCLAALACTTLKSTLVDNTFFDLFVWHFTCGRATFEGTSFGMLVTHVRTPANFKDVAPGV